MLFLLSNPIKSLVIHALSLDEKSFGHNFSLQLNQPVLLLYFTLITFLELAWLKVKSGFTKIETGWSFVCFPFYFLTKTLLVIHDLILFYLLSGFYFLGIFQNLVAGFGLIKSQILLFWLCRSLTLFCHIKVQSQDSFGSLSMLQLPCCNFLSLYFFQSENEKFCKALFLKINNF